MSRTDRIEKLAPEQVARLSEFRDAWMRRGLAVGPCDRPAMEAAADEAYRCAGLPPPRLKIWLGSPYAGAIVANLLATIPKNVWDQVRAQVWAQVGAQVRAQVWAQVRDQVGAQVWAQVWDQVGDQVWDQVGAQVWAQVLAQVRAQVGAQAGDQVGDQFGQAGYGQHDASWLAFYDFFSQVCGLEICNRLRGLNLLSECGWWWPFAGAVILTERPTSLHRDEAGRLHSHTGAAITYPDGFAIFASHGVLVRPELITQRASITTAKIDAESNAEIRRVMIELYGQDRYLLDSGARVISHDHAGILYRKDLPDDEPIVMVRVLNSTPEPDGVMSREEAIAAFGKAAGAALAAPEGSRFKQYMLRVDPDMRPMLADGTRGRPQSVSALNAVASTFGLRGEEYAPDFES